MPRTEKTAAAQTLVTSIQAAPDDPALDLIASLAEAAAGLMLGSYTPEDWQDSPEVNDLRRAAEMLESAGREVRHAVEEALAQADAVRDRREPRP